MVSAGLIIATFVLYASLTGGIDIVHANTFGGQRSVQLTDGVDSRVSISATHDDRELPFIVHWHESGPPFRISIAVEDPSEVMAKVSVKEVIISFLDGEEIILQPNCEWSFKDDSVGKSKLRGLIPNAFQRFSDVRLRINGELHRKDGAAVPFQIDEKFSGQQDFSVTTFWDALSRM